MLYPLPQTERLIHFADESPSVDVKFANAVPDGRDTARIWMQPQAEMGLPSPSGEYSGPPPGTAEAIITVISSDCNPIVENLRLFWYNWMTIYGA